MEARFFDITFLFISCICIEEHIGHVGKMSVSGYSELRLISQLHQYVVSLSNTLNLH